MPGSKVTFVTILGDQRTYACSCQLRFSAPHDKKILLLEPRCIQWSHWTAKAMGCKRCIRTLHRMGERHAGQLPSICDLGFERWWGQIWCVVLYVIPSSSTAKFIFKWIFTQNLLNRSFISLFNGTTWAVSSIAWVSTLLFKDTRSRYF